MRPRAASSDARIVAAVTEMAEAGIGTIQLRAKHEPDDRLEAAYESLCEQLAGWPGELWIDDRVDLAALYAFAGVHLGQRDLAPSVARPLLRPEQAIGWSTHGSAQVEAGEADRAVDWIALGPIFPTTSKERPDPVVGLEGLAEARARTTKPLVAIGGIDESNLARVLAAGADSVAVHSAICDGDVAINARRLLRAAAEAS